MAFPHLNLNQVFEGKPKYSGFSAKQSLRSLMNIRNRAKHTNHLRSSVQTIQDYWEKALLERDQLEFPDFGGRDIIPLLLQVDPSSFDIESLSSYKIEIISEEVNGYILGASVDNFQGLRRKIDEFEQAKRDKNGKVINQSQARLWEITDGRQWKIDNILSENLRNRWGLLDNEELLTLDIGIACYLKVRQFPTQKAGQSEEKFLLLVEKWHDDKLASLEERDEMADSRKGVFVKLVLEHKGEIIEGPVDTEDSFGFRVKISVKALRDLVYNYPYVFDVTEVESIIESPAYGIGFEIKNSLDLLPPDDSAPFICVIDSGIMEGHKYISSAIDTASSVSFLPGITDVADYVEGGGHGTRVAGAILYPNEIPTQGDYKLPFWIQNARVLNEDKRMPDQLYPPKLMRDIVEQFPKTRIFNLSINYRVPCRTTHMSAWAAAIDQLMWEKDILFIVSTGNIPVTTELHSSCQGIKDHFNSQRPFPEYLHEKGSRISNPSQSSFAISVGSISGESFEDERRHSISKPGEPSSFTKTGLGLWGSIKPDVVEFGGDLVKTKKMPLHIFSVPQTSPILVRSTLDGNGAFGRDSVGTSYSTPKISHIAGRLQSILPDESVLMYRALIAQSARLTNNHYRNSNLTHIRSLGYGLPDMDRALGNFDKRVTLISSNIIGASQIHIYSVKIPQELREIGDQFDVMIEITLSYKARPRRTRRRTKSYLSTWLDWEAAKLDEPFNKFRDRMVSTSSQVEYDIEQEETYIPNSSIPWTISAQQNWGKIKGVKRQDSTLQKDWCIVKSNQLHEEFLIAVRGHKGWDKDPEARIPYSLAISFESLEAEVQVYEKVEALNRIESQVRIG